MEYVHQMEKNSHRLLCVLTSQTFNTITVLLLWVGPVFWIVLRCLLHLSVQLWLSRKHLLKFLRFKVWYFSLFLLKYTLVYNGLFNYVAKYPDQPVRLVRTHTFYNVLFAACLHWACWYCWFPVVRSREEMVSLNSGGKLWMGLTFSACQAKVRNLHWP